MLPEWITKPWGRTACLYADGRCEHWVAHVEAGGYSSRHFHRAKMNRLASLDAVVVVTMWNGDRERTILQPGDYTDVPAGLVHQFDVVRSGRMWEWYSGEQCDPADIVRLSANGRTY